MRLDQEQPQLGDTLGLADEEHRADDFAAGLGDPATLARWIVLAQEIGRDLGDERFERRVVSVLLRIEGTVPMDDPADIAGPVRAERDLRRRFDGAAARMCSIASMASTSRR